MPITWQGSIEETTKAIIAEGKSPEQAAVIAHDLARKHGVSKGFTRDLELALPICKSDDEQKTVTGWAALSTDDTGQLVVDFQDEHVPVSELEKVAHDIVANGGAGMAGEMHQRHAGDVVESMVFAPGKAESLFPEIKNADIKKSGWAVTMRLDDAAWANYKSGKRPELSMHGHASMEPVGKRDGRTVYMRSNLDVDEISIVDRGASGNERVQPRIVLAKRAGKQGDRTMPQKKEELKKQGVESIVELEAAGFSDEQKKIVYALIEAAHNQKPAPESKPAPMPDVNVDAEKKAAEEAAAKAKAEEIKKSADKAKASDPLTKALLNLSDEHRAVVEKALAEKSQSEEKVAMEKRHADEKAELEKRVDDLEKARKSLEADRELSEMTKRAEKRPYIPTLSTEAQAKLLVKAKHAMGDEGFDELDRVLTAVDEGMRKSEVLKQFGSDKDGESDSAADKLKAMAKRLVEEMRKNGSSKKPTMAQAYREVCRDNPDLYADAVKANVQ